jgi:folate-binding protein YgfZ
VSTSQTEQALPTSPLLQRPGAVVGTGRDAGVAAHYGDPHREQRLLEEGLACVDLSHRGVLTVTGPDRLRWLHSLTTQQLVGLEPRQSRETLILSPKGHIEHALHVVDDGETSWLTTEPGAQEAVRSWLDSMRFMLAVEVADRTADIAVLGEPVGTESAAGEPLAWVDPWPNVVGDSTTYGPAEHPAAGRAWRELLVPRAQLEDRVGSRPPAGQWAAEALRVQAWRPRVGAETDHRTIPHELDWLRTAVHLHKGCYRGQETVARVHNLGRPPRRLVFLHLDGSGHTLPEDGAELSHDGKVVGRLTSVARHHEDGPVALGVVKRTLDPGAVLHAGSTSAAQTLVVTP